MKIKLLVAAAATLVANSAMAVGSFDGINAQIGVGVSSLGTQNSNTYSNTARTGNDLYSGNSSLNLAQTGVMGTASIGYSYGFAGGFNLAANAFYLGGTENAGQVNSYSTQGGSNTPSTQSNNTQFKLKNIWGIVVEPGYYFGKDSLGFAKLGMAQASVSGTSSDYNTTNTPTTTNTSLNFGTTSGFLYGLGFKQMVAKNVYVGVEAYQIMFGSKSVTNTSASGSTTINTSNKPNLTYGGITLGYKF